MAMVQLNLDALQATISALKIAIRDMTDAAAGLRRRLDYVWLSAPGLAAWTPGGSVEAELRDILADLQRRFDMGVHLLDLCSTGMDGMSAPGPHMVWLDETLLDDQDAQTVADLITKYGQGDDPLTDVPKDLLDLLAADSDDPEFGRHLATLLDPLDAAALLATLDSIRHPYGPAVGNGVSTPGFEARLDQLVTHLGQALGAGLQTLPPDQQQQVSDRWASAFTTAPIAAPDLSLIISRGAWPDVFLTDVSDAITTAENDWASGLSHLASNTDPPETFWMHSGATPITDPGQRLANGDFIDILDPMYGVWMAARTNPDWMAQRYLGGDVTTISYDLDGRQDLQGELPTALWGLFDTRGTDASALTAFLQAAGVSDMSASLSGDTGSILSDLQIVQGAFDLKQREYDAESPWEKYHHQILGAIATVTGIAAMIAIGGAAAPLAVGLMAASTAAMVVDLGYNIAKHDTAGAILDAIFLLLVTIGGTTKLVQFTRLQVAALRAGMQVNVADQWVNVDEKGALFIAEANKAAAPESANARIVQSGGAVHPRFSTDKQAIAWANETEEAIRASSADIDQIAKTLKDVPTAQGEEAFSQSEVIQIKEHLFETEHPLTDYDHPGQTITGRYDPDPDIVAAWLRLTQGDPIESDFTLLQHEYAEMKYYEAHPGASYSEAHQAANGMADWEHTVKSILPSQR